MLSGVTPQLFIHLILPNRFFFQVALEPYQNQGDLWALSLQWQSRRRPTTGLLSLQFHSRQCSVTVLYHPPCCTASAKDRITGNLKDTSATTTTKTGPAFSVSAAHPGRAACSSLVPSVPDQAGASRGRGSLPHPPPVSPFPGWTRQAIWYHVASSPHRGLVNGQISLVGSLNNW